MGGTLNYSLETPRVQGKIERGRCDPERAEGVVYGRHYACVSISGFFLFNVGTCYKCVRYYVTER